VCGFEVGIMLGMMGLRSVGIGVVVVVVVVLVVVVVVEVVVAVEEESFAGTDVR